MSVTLPPSETQARLLDAFTRRSLNAPTKYDLYIFSPIDNYWPSEYHPNGTRLPFTCGFIVQISPTQIQVHEYQPMVLAGKQWTLGHSGPGRYLDIRRVEPTIDDRNNLLHEFRRILGP